jgi:hypothetical protein
VRTTLELDDALHELARRRAFEERRSIGDVISAWAAKGLVAEQQALAPRPLGRFRGQITVADDFDATPDEVIESLDRPVA